MTTYGYSYLPLIETGEIFQISKMLPTTAKENSEAQMINDNVTQVSIMM